jgi:hypothetical protein
MLRPEVPDLPWLRCTLVESTTTPMNAPRISDRLVHVLSGWRPREPMLLAGGPKRR